jgi:nucleoside-diphosphate-sugar epimerase
VARLAAVTGATGFLGGYVVEALIKEGWQVRILARRNAPHPQLAAHAVETVLGDLADRRALDRLVEGASSVVHAAGLVKAPDAATFRRVNVDGTANLVDALNDCAAPGRLVLVSSMAAREPQLSAYAETKRASEAAVSALRHANWCIVRPCAIYGPWDREMLGVFRSAAHGIFPVVGPRDARIAMIHAADAARAVASLCDPDGSGRVFELTDRRIEGYGWTEIADTMQRALGNTVLKLPLPAPAVRAVATANMLAGRLFGRSPMLTPGKAREILHADWASVSARQPPPSLWQPRIALDNGFRETVAWYRDRAWLPKGQSDVRI